MLKPLYDRVLVRRDAAESVTTGGILVPEQAKNKKDKGTVLNVGVGRPLASGGFLPMAINIGDKVLFATRSGTEVQEGDEKLVILREEDILGILEGEGTLEVEGLLEEPHFNPTERQ